MKYSEVTLQSDPFQEVQKDAANNLRKVWIFPLAPKKDHLISIPKETIMDRDTIVAKKTKKLSDKELKERAEESHKIPRRRGLTSNFYERNPYVAEYAKRQANGKCQLCGQDAPFKNKKGEPYLETHHIVWLSEGGEDTIQNTVALCPNCHKKIHILNDKEDLKKLTH